MGTFQDRTSMERILFAIFIHENHNQGLALRPDTPLDVTIEPGGACGGGARRLGFGEKRVRSG
jgi:hypothetical protein